MTALLRYNGKLDVGRHLDKGFSRCVPWNGVNPMVFLTFLGTYGVHTCIRENAHTNYIFILEKSHYGKIEVYICVYKYECIVCICAYMYM